MLENLASKKIIIKNEYFYKYLALIATDFSNTKNIIFNKHHIIPRCYFKHFGLTVDSTDANIKYMPIDKHILAHYYLAKCSNQSWFEYSNLCAINFFLKKSKNSKNELISEEELLSILPDLTKLQERALELNRLAHTGSNNANYGKHLSHELKIKLSSMKKGIYNSNHRAGAHLSSETKAKLSIAHRGKHLNKATKEIYCVELDKVFPSVSAAAKNLDALVSSISSCLTGHTKIACGYHWKYYKEVTS